MYSLRIVRSDDKTTFTIIQLIELNALKQWRTVNPRVYQEHHVNLQGVLLWCDKG